jgi:hypothetical protein
VVRTDPTDNGGLFIGRRPGTAPIRYRALPARGTERRRHLDAAFALVLGGLMVFVNLLFWGPLPAAWLWVGSQVNYQTGSVTAGIFVAFLGLILTLMGALVVLKRLDHAWILVRRAAGHDQRKGIIAPIFAVTAAIGATGFTIWLVFIGGLGPTLAPRVQ